MFFGCIHRRLELTRHHEKMLCFLSPLHLYIHEVLPSPYTTVLDFRVVGRLLGILRISSVVLVSSSLVRAAIALISWRGGLHGFNS